MIDAKRKIKLCTPLDKLKQINFKYFNKSPKVQ